MSTDGGVAPLGGQRIAYGDHPDQFVVVHMPRSEAVAIVVVIHGGFWRPEWTVANAVHPKMLEGILERNAAVVVVEYRRNDESGGGWPRSNADVLAALNGARGFVARTAQNAPGQEGTDAASLPLGVQGHSAGGTLCLWAAQKAVLEGTVDVKACLSITPVGHLRAGWAANLGDDGGAVQAYLGEPVEPLEPTAPESVAKLEAADPYELLPMGMPTILVTGSRDDCVPPGLVRDFYDRVVAAEGPASGRHRLLDFDGADHLQVVDGTSAYWEETFAVFWEVLTKPSSSD